MSFGTGISILWPADYRMRRPPARVGLTGGIGSGKSTVAVLLAGSGVPVLDLDAVGHAVLKEDARVQQRIVDFFGATVCAASGVIDRGRLAAVAFADAAALRTLNSIIHPVIWQREEAWLARQSAAPYVVIEAPVLIESGAHSRMDAVVVVLADEAVRRARVLRRADGASRFEAVIARQCSDEVRRKVADYLIVNDAGMDELRRQVEQLHDTLLTRFGS